MNEKQMQDMAVSILLDEYTQLDVAQLLKEYDEAEENGEVPNMPDALDEACNQMIQREFSKKKQKKIVARISKTLSRVAMVTLMLIGLFTVSVLSVKAWRVSVLRFVLENFDRYSTVGMEGDNSQSKRTPEEIIALLAESVPKEYVVTQKSVQDGYYQIKYAGKKGERASLIVSAYLYDDYFDTESTEGTRIRINNSDVIYVNKSGYKVIWLNEESGLLIEFRTVSISEKDFWKIANKLIR